MGALLLGHTVWYLYIAFDQKYDKSNITGSSYTQSYQVRKCLTVVLKVWFSLAKHVPNKYTSLIYTDGIVKMGKTSWTCVVVAKHDDTNAI